MAKILIIYSTTDGHTVTICHHLQEVIEQQSHQVTISSIDDAQHIDPALFDKIVIGASIRYGKHSPQVYDYIKRNQQMLESAPSALFSVNLVARKPDKRRADTNPYVKKFLKQTAWQPAEIAVFAGKLDYPRYSYRDRLIIRLIMWITKGPTAPDTVKVFTDWEQVDAFGKAISEM
ncbi:MAG: menaquinone-dependent protoporphyrinogen IX dehydrogenase [Gammaproteobacteria bacterium]|nr:menaquinone-dependent protoporphyrinogen IX dehydrogenase [Gammaproteobacteria bacterium]